MRQGLYKLKCHLLQIPKRVRDDGVRGIFLAKQPTPDWKGREAVAAGNGAERRNPGKRDKMPSLAFYPASFLAKIHQFFLLTNDAPSVALSVCD